MKLLPRLLVVLVALLGMIDAAFITREKLLHIIPPCTPGFACETVLTSKWASIGPVPLSAVGFVFYTIIFAFAVLNFLEVEHLKPLGVTFHTHDVLMALTTFGACFSAYLIFIMGFLIRGWCIYCLFSALCCASLFFLSAWVWRIQKGACTCEAKAFRPRVFQFLYRLIAKPLFFQLDPEFIHVRLVSFGSFLGSNPVTKSLTRFMFATPLPAPWKTIDGIKFAGPVGLSAGFDWNGTLTQILPSVGFGFMTIGTVTWEAYQGNAAPRLGRLPNSKALVVNKGFMNMGTTAMIQKLEKLSFPIPVGVSIGSTNKVFKTTKAQIADIVSSFKAFEASRVENAYYELNISCPNTKNGQPFAHTTELKSLLTALKALKIKKPVYLKMPIDYTDKETLALLKAADTYSFIKGVIFGNLTKDKTNPDVTSEDRKTWEQVAGNLSGKPTWNRSNHFIALTKKTFKKRFTIIGVGGIFSAEDAKQKMKLGADAVELITGMIYEGPQLIGDINRQVIR